MTSLIKNQILKHLTKFFKGLVPEQLQLSAFKGSCELVDLQLEEKVLMELLSFPAWIKINKATCDQISIKIPWTKIKSVPIQMILNEVSVEVEVCEEFRDIDSENSEINQMMNQLNSQAPSKYGFVDRAIDGITVTINNVLITFKSKLMVATFNLSRALLESRCPNWKPGELSLTRIKDVNRGQILLFKVVEWQTMRIEAKCLTDPQQAPLRLITNHAQVRLTIKKNLDDCSVVAARIFVIFEDILWVLTFAQFVSAASFVEYIFALVKRSPMRKKNGPIDERQPSSSQSNLSNLSSSSFSQSTPLISPLNTPIHSMSAHNDSRQQPILTGNLSSATLTEQKFICNDLIETSLHLFIDKVDAHLYDDIEISSSSRDSGGALQTTLDQIQVDCYPYSRATTDRKHWYRWFDPSPSTRKQWLNSHFAEFDLARASKYSADTGTCDDGKNSSLEPSMDAIHQRSVQIPAAKDDQLLSLTVLVKVKDYCMNCVATKNSMRGHGLNKFIHTDKDYQMPSDMPSIYLELDYFYYFDSINRMMIYDDVPDPLAFAYLSPTKLLFDSPTLVFLNTFQMNLSKALRHLEDLFPEETTSPKVHCRVEILMPQICLPAKSNDNQTQQSGSLSGKDGSQATSALLVRSGKVTLSNSVHDKKVLAKLMDSIELLRKSPSQPINLGGGGYQNSSARKENSCVGDWNKVWNDSLIKNQGIQTSAQNQLWTVQFEPVWMDFMNYDVDDLASGQRLEPIVEPFNAYAFLHLNLSSTLSKFKTQMADPTEAISMEQNKRDIISILVTVMDDSIWANMDKVQFSFLQRLGMHVEKLLQQIKADASTVIQMDTVLENTLEVNLTAYIKEIKARLILDRKVELARSSIGDHSPFLAKSIGVSDKALLVPIVASCGESFSGKTPPLSPNKCFNLNPLKDNLMNANQNVLIGAVYSPGDDLPEGESLEGLDECVEVAGEALFLSDDALSSTSQIQALKQPTESNGAPEVTPAEAETVSLNQPSVSRTPPSERIVQLDTKPESSLLIDLEEMEKSATLFTKMDLKSKDTTNPDQFPLDHDSTTQGIPQQQQIETESISYLELSMSQLMVRRITETKRRQRF